MAIKKKKPVDRKYVMLALAICGAVLVSLIFLLLQNRESTRSQRNLTIMREAIEKNDVSICDQIEGGIQEQVPKSPKGSGVNIVARAIPAMTEQEAKADCSSDVQRAQLRIAINMFPLSIGFG